MNKRLATLGLALAMLTLFVTSTLAADLQCEVKSVEGKNVVLDCGREAGKLSAGDKVQIKAPKERSRGVAPGY